VTGFILYEGPSVLDGAPIVCIATKPVVDPRKVYKTQGIYSTYIIRADLDPIEAINQNADVSICGDCVHRGDHGINRSCYVPVWGGVRNIWLAYKRGKYASGRQTWDTLIGETVRLGSYGDPAAVPIVNLDFWLDGVGAVVGYTHQWRDPRFQELKRWAMASCESLADVIDAHALGWRTFRVRTASDHLMSHEVICPASAEAGHKANCAECRACGGLSSKAKCDIAIIAHGDKGKVRAFERKVIA
jgi:hypothetical protein